MDVTPIPKGSERGAPRCDATGELKRSCGCSSCIGRRNFKRGRNKQRAARKAIERASKTQAARFHGKLGNEESWSGLPVRAEVKAGAQAGPVATRFLAVEAQSKAATPIGDMRPFVGIFMPDGFGDDGLVVHRLSQWEAICNAMLGAGE